MASPLPLIYQLKREIPDVNHPYYADDTGAGGNFEGLCHYFERLRETAQQRVLPRALNKYPHCAGAQPGKG
jgi:hypothetical protein